MTARLIYLGSPEAPARSFSEMAQGEWPTLQWLATDDRAVVLAHAAEAHGIIALQTQFDDELLRRAHALRWIHTLTSGTDAVLKQPALSDRVRLTSTRGIHGPQMSELVFLHMLALARDFPRLLRHQQQGRWERWSQRLLWQKTVAIVGVGAISEALAPRCQAFGMRVIGVSSTPRALEGFDAIYERHRLHEAVALADFVVLVVPHTPANDNLIDASVLAAMKPTAYLINVARGGVLDEEALLVALRSGKVAGAALDVFREMPLPPEHPLWREPNVIVTPILGGMSDVYLHQAWPLLRHNITCFAADRWADMVNPVSRVL